MIGRALFWALAGAMFVFLVAPVLFVIPLSFSADASLAFPPSGWSLRWYAAMAREPGLGQAAANSFLLASIVTAAALLIGTPAAYAIDRLRFTGREALLTLLTAPLLLPTIVIGLALLILFVGYGLVGSWTGLVLAHLTITLPYALRVLGTALSTLPQHIEDAAGTLGAPPAAVFRRITLPLMLPGVLATAAIVFLVSLDEAVISLFVVGPQLTTLPVALFRYVQGRTDPLVAAVSTLLVVFSLLIVLALDRLVGLRRAVENSP